jgi:NhaP-type Na+/H+ or K+/H+ antiporter
MAEVSPFTLGFVVIGALMIVMTISGSFISRLPVSAAMLYLLVGMGIGPSGLRLIDLDLVDDSVLLERATEIAVIISLFVAGMKLDIPLRDRRWRIPLQLAFLSMVITVGAITAMGVYGLGLSLGASVLLGAVLAPTDPVLASDVQMANAGDRDRLRFGLTGEGALNDGTAFPFVMLGLGLLSLHELGDWGWRWWTVDVFWAILGGLGIGYLLGAMVGRVVLHLRTQHREALGSDEFIALGLIALAYGVALLCHTYGFLAVFAAGLALGRIDRKDPLPFLPSLAQAVQTPCQVGIESQAQPGEPSSDFDEPTPAGMMRAAERFNAQLERVAEMAVVLAVGALLTEVDLSADLLWFIPLLFLIVRPFAVYVGLWGTQVERPQRRLIAWFGIRGIGSMYYLMYAISHDLNEATADRLASITIAVVVASVVAHGISVTPLMNRYEKRRKQQMRM